MNSEELKRLAAARAVDLVHPGMKLGLGTGSTAKHFVDLLGQRVRSGLDVICVPTSEATRAQAESLGIPLSTLDETPELDLTVDGADEIDGKLRLVKGGGGALLREKIVAKASARMIVIADLSKRVDVLGAFPLPIEVAPFGAEATRRAIMRATAELGLRGRLELRRGADGHAFVTDGGHLIFDASFGSIPEPERLSDALVRIPGVLEDGFFIGIATGAILAGPQGLVILGSLGA